LIVADFAGLDNVPNRASNQTGTLQFIAIDRESLSTWMRIRHGHDGRRANHQEDKGPGKWIAVM
jgi:hypothetical protein